MVITSTLGSVVPTTTVQTNDVATTIAQATESIVNAVVDAASSAKGTDNATPDDTLLQIAVWIVDVAGVLAQDALNLTQSASAADMRAQQVADCARTWSIIGAIVAAIVIVIVAIVVSVFSFGAATPAVSAIVVAVAAQIAAIATIVQAMPSSAPTIQAIVIGALYNIQSLSSPSTPADQREQLRRNTIDNLRRAMTMIQAAEVQHMPSMSVDLSRSIAVADQTSRALQKLLTYLRLRQAGGRTAVVVTELGQLAQMHAALVAQLKLAPPSLSSTTLSVTGTVRL